jgi:hypothetical protein
MIFDVNYGIHTVSVIVARYYPRPTQVLAVIMLTLDKEKSDEELADANWSLPQIARRTNLNFANIGTGQGKTNIAAFVGLYTRLFFEKWSEWQQQKWWKENKHK